MTKLNIILVAISLFYVAANADRVRYELYYNKKCSGTAAYFKVQEPIGKCIKDGSSSKKVAADLKKTTYYGSTTCGGTNTGVTTLAKTCTALMSFSYKYSTITDAALSEARSTSGNLVQEKYDGSDSCAVASDSYVEYTIYPASGNGKCVETALSRGKNTWDSKKYVSKAYSKAGCTGTEAVQADKEVNKCLNTTTSSSTKSEKYVVSTVSSATVAFNAMYATLFAFIVAVAIM